MKPHLSRPGRGNIVLIGMPGAGKSTVGVLLAKQMGLGFLDTDLLLQQSTGLLLPGLLKRGVPAFLRAEGEVLLQCARESRCVIATGGSAVLCGELRSLQKTGITLYLQLPLPLLQKRLQGLAERGVVREANETLADIYNRRTPLYEAAADITLPCAGLTPFETVQAAKGLLNNMK